jgi:hypothetical protein
MERSTGANLRFVPITIVKGGLSASRVEIVTPPLAASVFHVNAKDAAWVDSKTTPHPTVNVRGSTGLMS